MRATFNTDAPYAREAVVTRFWSQVDASAGPDACWPWTGYSEKGYGRTHFMGRMVGAHELAVSFTTGERRAEHLETCHSCNNPPCCNPAHLRFDTSQSNAADAVRSDRHARGERNGHAKLTEVEVLTMRHRAAGGATGKVLASEYGVSQGLVTEILRGSRWKHVGGPLRSEHGNHKHGRYARASIDATTSQPPKGRTEGTT